MNNRLKNYLFLITLLFFVNGKLFAGDIYKSEDAKFKVTFPTAFDEEVDKADDMTIVSLSCTYNDMILLVSAFIYDEVIPEDEYALKIADGIIVTADAFNSKFKEKQCVRWEVPGGHPGLKNTIKGKINDGKNGKFKFYGNIYITMAHGIEYRLTALSTKKKNFNTNIESRFINSFGIL